MEGAAKAFALSPGYLKRNWVLSASLGHILLARAKGLEMTGESGG